LKANKHKIAELL